MIPISMANCWSEMREPRTSGGAHSALYMGTIMERDPTPIPLKEKGLRGRDDDMGTRPT